MKLSVTTLGWPASTLEQIVSDITAAGGFAGIDFRGLGEELDITRLPAFNAELNQTRARLMKAGLVISGLSSSVRLVNDAKGERAAAEVLPYCQLADRAGVAFVRVFAGRRRADQTRPAWMAEAVENLKRDLDRTAGCQALLCVETHDDWCHTADVAELLDAVNHPRAAALWDIMITSCAGGESVAQSAATLGRRIRYTHLKDGRVEGDNSHVLTLPGQGSVDLVGAVAELKKLGYEGWLTFEWEKRWHADLPDASVALPMYRTLLKAAL